MPEFTLAQLKKAHRLEGTVRELARFVQGAFAVIQPGVRLKWNWHHDLICREVQALMMRQPLPPTNDAEGEPETFVELVVCEPPRFLKSLIANVCAPLWLWLHDPTFKLQVITNDAPLGIEMSQKARDVLTSPWYLELIGYMVATRPAYDPWRISKSQSAKVNFQNTMKGRRQALSVGGLIIGKGGNGQIIDDPIDVKHTLGAPDRVVERLDLIEELYDTAWRSRLDDPLASWRLVIMQRLHPKDLAGRLIKRGVRALVLPQRFAPDFPAELGGVHYDDPRKVSGELLHPERMPMSEIEAMLNTPSGRRFVQTQHDQRPSTPGGTLFKTKYVKRHDPETIASERRHHQWAISVDSNFKKSGSSRCSIGLWAKKGARYKLQRAIAEHMDYPELRRRVLALYRAHQSDVEVVLIEAAANGHALIQELSGVIPCVKAITPRESKHARAQRCAPIWEAGNVSVAEGMEGEAFIDEVISFPSGSYDDALDMMTQLLNYWTGSMVEVGFSDLYGNEVDAWP